MMISPREITLGLYGAFRLALLDVRGMAYFNCTEAGFWRSFTAAAIAAPESAKARTKAEIYPAPDRFTYGNCRFS